MMENETQFVCYCVELYKSKHHLTGAEVINLFNQYGALEYIIECYPALHTTGAEYTINDIDEFIEERKEACHDY
jgi:hypothetical protein